LNALLIRKLALLAEEIGKSKISVSVWMVTTQMLRWIVVNVSVKIWRRLGNLF